VIHKVEGGGGHPTAEARRTERARAAAECHQVPLPTVLAGDDGEASLQEPAVEGDPKLASYDPSITDGTWQDFRLTAASTLAIDKGAELPASLTALLAKFGMDSGQKGAALDLGAIEFDPDNPSTPVTINVGPRDGGTSEAGAPWPIPTAGDGGAWTPTDGGSGSGGCGCVLGGRDVSARSAWPWLLGLAAVLASRPRRRGSPDTRD